jgi:hypothetical protein
VTYPWHALGHGRAAISSARRVPYRAVRRSPWGCALLRVRNLAVRTYRLVLAFFSSCPRKRALIFPHKSASDSQVHPPTMAERRTGQKKLHRCRACFETRSASALSMRAVLDGIKKIPQPEEAAQRPSRRPHGANPACLCGLRDLGGGLTRDDCAQSQLWVKVQFMPGASSGPPLPRGRRRSVPSV